MPREAYWSPKYAHGVAHGWELPDVSPTPQEVGKKRQAEPGQKSGYVYRNVGERTGYSGQLKGSGWVYAPATSHISRFLFTDARQNADMAEYGLMGGASQLQVVFKGANYSGEVDEYVYYFSDHDTGIETFKELSRSAHPYAEVLLPDVINGGIPYFRLAHITPA